MSDLEYVLNMIVWSVRIILSTLSGFIFQTDDHIFVVPLAPKSGLLLVKGRSWYRSPIPPACPPIN